MQGYNVKQFKMPRWDQLPKMGLYLDQVIMLIDDWMSDYVEVSGSMLTHTMVNNYVKQKIVRAPVNRRYDRRSIASLIVVSIVKPAFPIGDIAKLIRRALEGGNAEASYNDFCEMMEDALKQVFFLNGQAEENNLPEIRTLGQGITREDRDLFINVARTCASQFYVRSVYLEKEADALSGFDGE